MELSVLLAASITANPPSAEQYYAQALHAMQVMPKRPGRTYPHQSWQNVYDGRTGVAPWRR